MPDETADSQSMFCSTVPGFGNYGEKYIRGGGTEQLLTARLESTPWELQNRGLGKAAKNEGENRLPQRSICCQKTSKAVNDET